MSSQTLNKSVANNSQNIVSRYNKVLLIDDNSLDNFVNKKLLESNGFTDEAIAVQSATDALAYLKSNKGNDLPNLIFLDIIMPEMDGFQFLDAFENLTNDIKGNCKIIMLSTSESFKDLNKANKNKFVKKFLNKPLTLQILDAINV